MSCDKRPCALKQDEHGLFLAGPKGERIRVAVNSGRMIGRIRPCKPEDCPQRDKCPAPHECAQHLHFVKREPVRLPPYVPQPLPEYFR